jgi:hypothetical protein
MAPEDAARAADTLTRAMTKTDNLMAQRWLPQGLSMVAAHLEPAQAARAADTLTQAMSKATNVAALPTLAWGLSAVAARMAPEDAARAADTLIQVEMKTTDRSVGPSLALALSALVARLEPAQAARAADTLIQAMTKTTDPNAWLWLAQGLSAVAVHLEPPQAARAADTLIRAMAKTDISYAMELAPALSAVAARMEPQEAARACAQVSDTFTQAMAKMPNSNALPSQPAQTLSRLLTGVDPPQLSRRSAAVLAAVGCLAGTGHPVATPALLAPALEPLPCRLSTPELVELLKQPTCIGPARRVVLDQLQNRYGQKFADQWAFVRFAQEQGLDLDFTSPPKRLSVPASSETR